MGRGAPLACRSKQFIEVTMGSRHAWLTCSIAFTLSFVVSWASLIMVLRSGGRYVSVLSWNLFDLEELCRHWFGGVTRTVTSPAAILPVALLSGVFTLDVLLISSPKWRVAGVVVGVLLLLATVIWIPNPWENM
jgi:hypothetical protein